jgi:hypothetical protein
MSLIQLIYASDLAENDEQSLTAILASAVRHNQKNGVTGMLVYSNNRFLQVLEGESAVVEETYSRIAADGRHKKIVPLLTETIATRSFDRWSMGFRHLEDHDFKEYPKYFPYFGIDAIDFDAEARPSIALEMLKIFSKLPA